MAQAAVGTRQKPELLSGPAKNMRVDFPFAAQGKGPSAPAVLTSLRFAGSLSRCLGSCYQYLMCVHDPSAGLSTVFATSFTKRPKDSGSLRDPARSPLFRGLWGFLRKVGGPKSRKRKGWVFVESASQDELCPHVGDTRAASLPAFHCPCVSLRVRHRRSRAGRNPSMPTTAERPALDSGPALDPPLTWAHTSPPQTSVCSSVK